MLTYGAQGGLGHHSCPSSFPHVKDLNGSQLVGRSHSRESNGQGPKDLESGFSNLQVRGFFPTQGQI